jgi:two-component system response regulator HydG
VGKFELADGGTLFLDEIENAPLSMQVDLLRVLQERCIERVGGNDTFTVDVRLVAATNRDLARMVEAGRFREDLLFRLGVLVLDVPPLRERRDDLVPLAEHFLARLAARRGGGPRSLSAEARRELFEHDWPGNVRELEHTIERSAVFETSQELERLAFFDARTKTPAPSAHPASGRAIEAAADGDPGTLEDARRRALEETDVRYLRAILGRFRGDVRRASAHAGLSRRGLYYLLDKYDLDAASFRDGHAPGLRVGNAPATRDGNAPATRDGNASAQRDGNAAALRDGDAPAQRAAIPCSPAAQPRAARAESPANPAWNERGAQPTRWHVN